MKFCVNDPLENEMVPPLISPGIKRPVLRSLSEPRSGGPVRRHPAESGPQPRHSGHAGRVFGLLHRAERESHHRETQGEILGFKSQTFIGIVELITKVSLFIKHIPYSSKYFLCLSVDIET